MRSEHFKKIQYKSKTSATVLGFSEITPPPSQNCNFEFSATYRLYVLSSSWCILWLLRLVLLWPLHYRAAIATTKRNMTFRSYQSLQLYSYNQTWFKLIVLKLSIITCIMCWITLPEIVRLLGSLKTEDVLAVLMTEWLSVWKCQFRDWLAARSGYLQHRSETWKGNCCTVELIFFLKCSHQNIKWILGNEFQTVSLSGTHWQRLQEARYDAAYDACLCASVICWKDSKLAGFLSATRK